MPLPPPRDLTPPLAQECVFESGKTLMEYLTEERVLVPGHLRQRVAGLDITEGQAFTALREHIRVAGMAATVGRELGIPTPPG